MTSNNPIHRTSGKLRLPASGDFQRSAAGSRAMSAAQIRPVVIQAASRLDQARSQRPTSCTGIRGHPLERLPQGMGSLPASRAWYELSPEQTAVLRASLQLCSRPQLSGHRSFLLSVNCRRTRHSTGCAASGAPVISELGVTERGRRSPTSVQSQVRYQ